MITYLILSIILFSIHCLIEARLETIEISLKVQAGSIPNYDDLNRKEHAWSAIFSISFVVLILLFAVFAWPFPLWKLIPYGVALCVLRRIFFDYGLKIMRKRPLKAIEGDQKTDSAVRKILGANGGLLELAIDVALLAGLIYLTL
jgi:hypothetical protein